MNINRKIKILAILVILTFVLVAIGISAYGINYQKPKCQKNNSCNYTEECSNSYCNIEQEVTKNCQQRDCSGFRS